MLLTQEAIASDDVFVVSFCGPLHGVVINYDYYIQASGKDFILAIGNLYQMPSS